MTMLDLSTESLNVGLDRNQYFKLINIYRQPSVHIHIYKHAHLSIKQRHLQKANTYVKY